MSRSERQSNVIPLRPDSPFRPQKKELGASMRLTVLQDTMEILEVGPSGHCRRHKIDEMDVMSDGE